MKHCSSCEHCIMDMKALMLGVYVSKCHVFGHNILHPFFNGFRCKKYKKERKHE